MVRKIPFFLLNRVYFYFKDQMQSTAIAAVEAAFRSFASLIIVLTYSGR
jgi:hypothetical protein